MPGPRLIKIQSGRPDPAPARPIPLLPAPGSLPPAPGPRSPAPGPRSPVPRAAPTSRAPRQAPPAPTAPRPSPRARPPTSRAPRQAPPAPRARVQHTMTRPPAQLRTLMRLHHAGVSVRDLDHSLEWYCAALGPTRVRRAVSRCAKPPLALWPAAPNLLARRATAPRASWRCGPQRQSHMWITARSASPGAVPPDGWRSRRPARGRGPVRPGRGRAGRPGRGWFPRA
jgi:catechol 2,3-dioxygenase-like lactoylglutathione lyase family enzyme